MALSVTPFNPGTIGNSGNAPAESITSLANAPAYNYSAGGSGGTVGTFSPNSGSTGVLGATTNGTGSATTQPTNNRAADYAASRNSAMNSINDTIDNSSGKYHSSILDYLGGRQAQQNTIDSESVQNELARQSGMQGILDMIGNGVKSSGSILANKNAGSSSAGEAIARAYGTLGRQQATGVGNQFAQGQDKVNTEENNLLTGDATQLRHTQEDKTNTINDIVNSARSQLASLNQAAQYASLPDRVDIEGKIAQIKQQALDSLTKYDSALTGGISGQSPMGGDAVRAKANGLLTAGTAPDTAFNYTTNTPAQFQDTGQFASSLPLFIAPRKQQTA